MQERAVRFYLWSSILLTGICSGAVYLICRVMVGDTQTDLCQRITLLAGLIALWIYGGWSLSRLSRQVDRTGDVLEEILADSVREEEIRQPETVWEEKLFHRYQEGVVGRLESHLLECVHILGQREVSHHAEQRYLKEMMTDISHQIKTPLASLQVFLDIFEKELTKPPMSDMVVQARRQADRIHRLVMGLLKLTQLESGMLPMEKEVCNLEMMLRECGQLVADGFRDKQLQIHYHGAHDCRIWCEREWMTEAFQNLIKNCCEYSPQGGTLQIQWSETQMAHIVQISDQGPGIEQSELPKIFNRFYRVHRSGQESSPEGIGIGLALAKEIVERQGGTLVAYSSTDAPSFTRFEVTLLKNVH